jgi:hypothetical protein
MASVLERVLAQSRAAAVPVGTLLSIFHSVKHCQLCHPQFLSRSVSSACVVSDAQGARATRANLVPTHETTSRCPFDLTRHISPASFARATTKPLHRPLHIGLFVVCPNAPSPAPHPVRAPQEVVG